jgi:hypothetical protein
MDINGRRLSFVWETRTQSYISSQTGIPQSTISKVVNGLIDLPSKYASQVRNLYQREAYSNLFVSGASSSQAKRFSWYIPETVKDVVETLNVARAELEVAWLARKSYSSDTPLTGDEILAIRKDAEDAILEALHKSKKTIEDIYTSGKKKMFSL